MDKEILLALKSTTQKIIESQKRKKAETQENVDSIPERENEIFEYLTEIFNTQELHNFIQVICKDITFIREDEFVLSFSSIGDIRILGLSIYNTNIRSISHMLAKRSYTKQKIQASFEKNLLQTISDFNKK